MTISLIRPTRRLVLAAAGVLAAPGVLRAQAQWPDRPIRAIVPFAAGGTTDVVARVVAEAASQVFGQQVVVENRTGAGLVVGTEAAARAEPDGNTVLITASPHVNTPSLVARLPYDPVADFRAVAMAGATPQLFVVNPRVPAQNLAEFIALIRANPGKYAFASAGVGSAIHVASLLFLAETKTEMLHVPYRGGGPAMQAVIAGRDAAGDGPDRLRVAACAGRDGAGAGGGDRPAQRRCCPMCRPPTRPGCPASGPRPGSPCSPPPACRPPAWPACRRASPRASATPRRGWPASR